MTRVRFVLVTLALVASIFGYSNNNLVMLLAASALFLVAFRG